MKMAIRGGQILLAEVEPDRLAVFKSWSSLKWDRKQKLFYGPVNAEMLNRLARVIRLPLPAEELRAKLNTVAEAVDAERVNPEPKAMYPFPVRLPLYKHQIRGANMALMVFGLIEPKEKEEAKT